MNIIGIIQARTGSTRLPGKVLKRICDKPILELLIERIKESKLVNGIVIATTDKKNDDSIAELAKRLGVNYYRGSEDDVMGRFYEAAKKFNADVFLRITSDNILMDPLTMDEMIKVHIEKNSEYTHIENLSFVAPEVVDFKAFEKAAKMTNTPHNREHVTPFFRLRPDLFRVNKLPHNFNGLRKEFRLTIDTQEDFNLLKEIYSRLYREGEIIALKDVYSLLDSSHELLEINKRISQKNYAVNILFRVDGNNELGLGHVYRCMNLAKEFKENVKIRFLMKEHTDVNALVGKQFEVDVISPDGKNEFQKTSEVIEGFEPDIVITDLLRTSEKYLKHIKDSGVTLVTIDDLNEIKFCSDMIINGSVVEKYWNYDSLLPEPFLGPKYMILKREFSEINKKPRTINREAKRILVSMGGSDPSVLAPKGLNALNEVHGDFEVVLVQGAAYEDGGQLEKAKKSFSKKLIIRQHVENMGELMFNCDLAITSAGIIVYELACSGTPAIAMSQVDSQTDTAKAMEKNGTLIDIGSGKAVSEEEIKKAVSALMENYELRQEMSVKGKKLVDGLGASRVMDAIISKYK